MSSFLGAGIDKDKTMEELEEIKERVFTSNPESCLDIEEDNLDDFLGAIGRVGDYVDENSKDKNNHNRKEETLSGVFKTLDEKTRELLIVVSAIPGTRTKEGLEALGKLLKGYEEHIGEAQKKLEKANFDKDHHKNANEVLGHALKHMKGLMGHITKTTEHKIKQVEKPSKKKQKEDKDKENNQHDQQKRHEEEKTMTKEEKEGVIVKQNLQVLYDSLEENK